MENKESKVKVRSNFRWSDSPPVANPGCKPSSKWDNVATRIRRNKKNAGRWALVAHGVYFSEVTRLKRKYPDINWVTRNKDASNRCDLWASLKVEG